MLLLFLVSTIMVFYFPNSIKKISKSSGGENLNETEVTTEAGTVAMKELAMKSNEAYETVDPHYDEVHCHNRRPKYEANEYIYEQPAL